MTPFRRSRDSAPSAVAPRSPARRGVPRAALAAVALAGWALAGAPRPAAAQTPSTAVGLGYPAVPVDARAAALGSTGIGLLGSTFSLRNPAELTEHPASGISITAQPEAVEVAEVDGGDDTGRSRFSTLRAVVRVDEWGVGVGFGSELDQDFVLRLQDTASLGVGRFPYEERREHDGGVSVVELSVARGVGPLSLGLAGQRLTGSLRQTFDRRFEPGVPDSVRQIANVGAEQIVSYGGWRARAGASLRLSSRFMAGASATLPGTLTADPEEGSAGASAEFDLPAAFDVGLSARPTERFLVTAAGGWTGWSSADGDGGLEDGTARDATWFGAGLEYWGVTLRQAPIPLRVGFRQAELPFSRPGFEPADETALTLGVGAIFERGGLPVAEGNVAFELGRRGDLEEAGFEESFRRFTVSVTLRQP